MNFFYKKIKSKLFLSILSSGFILISLYSILVADLVRARFIDYDDISEKLEDQRQKQILQNNITQTIKPKVVVQRGGKSQSGLDFRCLNWSTYIAGSQWKRDSQDSDFVIDYYLPPNKNAIICTTPLLAAALGQDTKKPFVYEVYPTEYGMQVRIILGVSDIEKMCDRLSGNPNCINWILQKQATLRYEPD